MFSFLRRHLSYSNVVATTALVFAMGGSAIAARHYLINSTRQINPKVLRVLKGNRGPTGPAGTAGTAGTRGATGPAGPSTGPAGGDLTGSYPNPTIAPNAVTGAKIADGSVTGADIRVTSLTHFGCGTESGEIAFQIPQGFCAFRFSSHSAIAWA